MLGQVGLQGKGLAAVAAGEGFVRRMGLDRQVKIREAAKNVIFLVARPQRPYPPPPLPSS